MTREQLAQAIIKAWKANAGNEGVPHDGWARIAAFVCFRELQGVMDQAMEDKP